MAVEPAEVVTYLVSTLDRLVHFGSPVSLALANVGGDLVNYFGEFPFLSLREGREGKGGRQEGREGRKEGGREGGRREGGGRQEGREEDR